MSVCREVVLGLLGHGGDLIARDGDAFVLNEDVADRVLHPGDRAIITQTLLPLATSYLYLSSRSHPVDGAPPRAVAWVPPQASSGAGGGGGSSGGGGGGRVAFPVSAATFTSPHDAPGRLSPSFAAFAEGIDTELDAYRDVVLDVETELVQDSHLPLSFVRERVQPFIALFRILKACMDAVLGGSLRGGRLLNEIHRCLVAQGGSPAIQAALQRLLHRCHRVFFSQLTTWLVYGLVDNEGEFFIRGPDLYIDGEMVPSRYIPQHVAESVLFVGKAVRLLRNPPPSHFGPGADESPLLTEEDEAAFLADLAALKAEPVFDLLTFECTVDRIKDVVTSRLWKLLVVDAKLMDHFSALKDYFLLARGEFWQMFLDNALGLFDMTDNPLALPYKEDDLNSGPFESAAQSSSAAEDPLFKQFSVVVASREFEYPPRPRTARLEDLAPPARLVFPTAEGHSSRHLHVRSSAAAHRTSGGISATTAPPPGGLDGAASLAASAVPLAGPAAVSAAWHRNAVVAAQGFTTTFILRVGLSTAIEAGVFPQSSLGFEVSASGVLMRPPHDMESVGATHGTPSAAPSVLGATKSGISSVGDLIGMGWSFLLQTEGLDAVAHVNDEWGRHDAVGNCIAIRFQLQGTSLKPLVKISVLSGTKSAGNPCSFRDLTCLGEGTGVIGITADGSIPITVDYRRPEAVGRRGRLLVSTSASYKSDEPALALDLTLSDVMRLRGVRGRCWVGFVGCTAGPDALDVTLSRWRFLSMSKLDEGPDGLGLAYNVKWPLHLVITQASLDHYNELFRFMLRVKRVGLALQDSWATLMYTKGSSLCQELQQVWLLRSRMAFVVTNLQYYLQLDVVESAFSKLHSEVLTSKDFEAVKRAHGAYTEFLVTRSFLRHPVVSSAMSEILAECTAFTSLVSRNASNLRRCISEDHLLLKRIETAFRTHTNFLFETQRAARGDDATLMLRMDFNGFFVKMQGAGGVGLRSDFGRDATAPRPGPARVGPSTSSAGGSSRSTGGGSTTTSAAMRPGASTSLSTQRDTLRRHHPTSGANAGDRGTSHGASRGSATTTSGSTLGERFS